MKKKIVFWFVLLSATVFTACQGGKTATEREDMGAEALDSTQIVQDEIAQSETVRVIEGYQLVDGKEVPVKVALTLDGIKKGEEAYKYLAESNPETPKPTDNKEYVVATFTVTYEEGEVDEIYMEENRGSLMSAGLYFALSNGDSNAEDVTYYLSDRIYNLVIVKGGSATGSIAFLRDKGSVEPLYFVGFNNTVDFDINK